MDYNKIREIEENEKLCLKDEQTWNSFDSLNQSGYGRAIMKYAERWAKTMQYLMKNENKTLAESAIETIEACDFSGISGSMYGCAVQVLEQCWQYGNELREWEDSRYDIYESDETELL